MTAAVEKGPEYVMLSRVTEEQALAECRRIFLAHPDAGLQLYLAIDRVRELSRPGPRVPTTIDQLAWADNEVARLYAKARTLP